MLLSEIIATLGGELQGDDVHVGRVAALENAQPDALAFLSNAKFKNLIATSAAGALLLKAEDAVGVSKPCIVTANPYLYYAKAAELLHPGPTLKPGIHPRAVVDATAQIHPDAQIGPNVVIEAGAIVGARAVLMANAYIGVGTFIGADTRVYPNVTVMADCVVGERVILHPGCSIGADGFGNAWDEDHWHKIPQVGRVVIGNDVEIGANTAVDRGAIGDTVIARGVRIDNLVMIAHNVHVGEHTAIAACTGIAGSAKIGARVQMGGGTRMSGHIDITDDVVLLNAALVAKSIKVKGVFAGNPLQTYEQWLKNASHLRHLDALSNKVKQLEKKLAAQSIAPAQEEE